MFMITGQRRSPLIDQWESPVCLYARPGVKEQFCFLIMQAELTIHTYTNGTDIGKNVKQRQAGSCV